MSRILKAIFLIAISFNSFAQDFHFSQFYNSPLTLNPALTGKFNEDFRIGVIHRDQWKAINSNFVTSAIFADVNFIKNPLRLDMWAVGLVAMNDEIGDGTFSNQNVGLSLSGTKILDELKRHRLSIGFQPVFVTKGLNTNNFIFDSQINSNYEADRNIQSGEQISGTRYNFFNLNAGVFWDFILNKRFDIFTGFSANNINRPSEHPLANSNSNLPLRYVLNPGFVYTISPRWSVTPNFLFAYQGKATEATMGLFGAYTLNPEKALTTTAFLGGWGRAKDAIIPMAGLKWGHYKLTFSYDFNASTLKDVRNAPTPMISRERASVGAWEVSFIYVGFLKRALPNETTVPCKFF